MEFNYRKIQEDRNPNLTGLIIKKLIEKTKKNNRQIAKELQMPESTLHDWINGVCTNSYEALDMMSKYFSKELGDSSITYRTLCLGSDELMIELKTEINELRQEILKKEQAAAWREAELKRQLELFQEKETA